MNANYVFEDPNNLGDHDKSSVRRTVASLD